MDATYKTNKYDLHLTIFSGVSSENKNVILGIAFVQRETAEVYDWLLNQLREFSDGLEPKTIITDFDPSMCAGIESAFSSKTTHLLCQWHMMQNFKKHFVYLTKRKTAASKLLYNHMMDLIFTGSTKKFQELQDIIFQSPDMLDEAKLSYLRSLLLIKEKWASAHQPIIFNSGVHTISRAESVNHMVKHKLTNKCNLVDLYRLITSVESKTIERTLLEGKREVRLIIHNPIMKELYQVYSRWAFEQMLY